MPTCAARELFFHQNMAAYAFEFETPAQGRGERGGCLGRQILGSTKIESLLTKIETFKVKRFGTLNFVKYLWV